MLTNLCFVCAIVHDATFIKTDVEQSLRLFHFGGTLQVACDDALRNHLIADVLSQQRGTSCRWMQFIERVGAPVTAPSHSSAINIVLAKLIGDVLNARISISLAPALRILVVDAVSSWEDAQANHFRLRIPGGEFPKKALISASERD